MAVLIGSIVVFQIIRGNLAGVADNIADIFGVMVFTDQFLFDLDAVLFRAELRFNGLDSLFGHISCQNRGDIFLIIVQAEIIAGNDHLQKFFLFFGTSSRIADVISLRQIGDDIFCSFGQFLRGHIRGIRIAVDICQEAVFGSLSQIILVEIGAADQLDAEIGDHFFILFILIDNVYDPADPAVEKLVVLGGVVGQIVHCNVISRHGFRKYLALPVPDGAALCPDDNRSADAALKLLLILIALYDLQSIQTEYEDSCHNQAQNREKIGSSPSAPSDRLRYLLRIFLFISFILMA